MSLDSSDRKLTAAQLAWLKGALAVPGPKVIFTHVPPDYIKAIAPLKEVGALEAWSANEGDPHIGWGGCNTAAGVSCITAHLRLSLQENGFEVNVAPGESDRHNRSLIIMGYPIIHRKSKAERFWKSRQVGQTRIEKTF